MKKFILIPDSFKGTMSSDTVCRIMARMIGRQYPQAEIVSIPVADGGEGSVDCFLSALGGEKREVRAAGVFGEEMTGFYGLLPDKQTAVVEMACCAGLPLAEGRLDPMTATTYGVGQLILAAAKDGARQIIVGLGGSATNDGGCGAAAAVGARFLNAAGEAFIPTGGTLTDIVRIDLRGLDRSLKDARITVMCDIDNPLYGEQGAAHVFAPQKGADDRQIALLDDGLRHLGQVIRDQLGMDVSALPGGGAAGGMGAGMAAFFGAKLQMGIQTVLDTVRFDEVLQGADLVFTGEGKIDAQSLRGKVVIGVARRAAKAAVPVVAIVGAMAPDAVAAYQEGVSAIFSINTAAMDFSLSRAFSEQNLELTMENVLRFAAAIRRE